MSDLWSFGVNDRMHTSDWMAKSKEVVEWLQAAGFEASFVQQVTEVAPGVYDIERHTLRDGKPYWDDNANGGKGGAARHTEIVKIEAPHP